MMYGACTLQFAVTKSLMKSTYKSSLTAVAKSVLKRFAAIWKIEGNNNASIKRIIYAQHILQKSILKFFVTMGQNLNNQKIPDSMYLLYLKYVV